MKNQMTNETQSTPLMKRPITKQQRNALYILGAALMIFGIIATGGLVLDGIPLSVQTLTISEANDIATARNTYVNLQDVTVLCNSLEYRRGRSSSTNSTETRYTFIWMTDPSAGIGVFAQYSGRATCDDIQSQDITGYLTRAGDTLPSEASPLPFGSSGEYMELCAFCGLGNSLGLLILFPLLAIAGIFLLYRGNTAPIIESHNTEKSDSPSTTDSS